LIAITGGIGSGKSVVARMLQVMGYQVYDCDSRAKALMTGDAEVKQQLINAFGEETFLADGSINRDHLSAAAFGNSQALLRLNAIVHPATARDMLNWAKCQAADGACIAFVETALLRTSGLDRLVDAVWHVTAPVEVRIARVMARNGLTAQQVRARIDAQAVDEAIATGEAIIVNDALQPVLPQVLQLARNCIDMS